MPISQEPKRVSRSALAHILVLIGGTGASQILTALAAPVLTRVYSPRAFGIYAIALAVLNLFSAVVCLRYELAIVLPRTDRSAANVMALCLGITGAMTFISALICAGAWTVQFFWQDGLQWWAALLLPFGVLFGGLQVMFRFWCIRHRAFPAITKIVLTQSLVTLAVQVAAGFFLSDNPAYLMLGTILGFLASVLVVVPQMSRLFPRALISAVRISRMRALAKRHRLFPIFASPYIFLSQASGRVLLIILSLFVSTATIGQFALAQRVIYLPVTLITASMSQVFFSRAVGRLDEARLHALVYRVMVAGIFCLGPFLIFNFFFSQQMFEFVFGVRWLMAGKFAAYLGFASGIVSLTAWLDRVYDIRGRQRLSLLMEGINDVFSLGTLTLILYFSRNVVAGVAGFSFATIIYYLAWTYVAFRIAPFPEKFFFAFLGAVAVVASYGVASGVLVQFLTSSQLFQAVLFMALGVPALLVGARIGYNGLNQRATVLASLRI